VVTAQVVPVTERLSALEQRAGKLRCTYQPAEPLDILDRQTAVTARIYIDFGEVSPDEGTKLSPEATGLLDRLRAEIDGELLDQLHDGWLRVPSAPLTAAGCRGACVTDPRADRYE
jgi:hypothetical protein